MKKLLLIIAILASVVSGSWTSGNHTFGTGGNATKLSACFDSLGTIAAGTVCTLTQISTITESATKAWGGTINGRLLLRNASPHNGDITQGYKILDTYAGEVYNIYPAGSGTIEICGLNFSMSAAYGATARMQFGQTTGNTIKWVIHDNIFNGNNKSSSSGDASFQIYNNPSMNIYNNIVVGFDNSQGNGFIFGTVTNDTIENNLAIGCRIGFNIGSMATSNVFRNNLSLNSSYKDYYFTTTNRGTAYNNGSSDITATSFNVGSGNKGSLTALTELVSVDTTSPDFAKVKIGSWSADSGSAVQIATNTVGIRQHPRPHSSILYSIGGDEYYVPIVPCSLANVSTRSGSGLGNTPVKLASKNHSFTQPSHLKQGSVLITPDSQTVDTIWFHTIGGNGRMIDSVVNSYNQIDTFSFTYDSVIMPQPTYYTKTAGWPKRKAMLITKADSVQDFALKVVLDTSKLTTGLDIGVETRHGSTALQRAPLLIQKITGDTIWMRVKPVTKSQTGDTLYVYWGNKTPPKQHQQAYKTGIAASNFVDGKGCSYNSTDARVIPAYQTDTYAGWGIPARSTVSGTTYYLYSSSHSAGELSGYRTLLTSTKDFQTFTSPELVIDSIGHSYTAAFLTFYNPNNDSGYLIAGFREQVLSVGHWCKIKNLNTGLWSDSIKIPNADNTKEQSLCNSVVLSNGDIIFTTYNTRGAYIHRSADGGHSWAYDTITRWSKTAYYLNESSILELKTNGSLDHRVIVVWRSTDTTGTPAQSRLKYMLSSNYGLHGTWGQLETDTTMYMYLYGTGESTKLLSRNYDGSTILAGSGCGEVDLITSSDEWQTRKQYRTFIPNAGNRSSYASWVDAGEGFFHTLFSYNAPGPNVKVAEFDTNVVFSGNGGAVFNSKGMILDSCTITMGARINSKDSSFNISATPLVIEGYFSHGLNTKQFAFGLYNTTSPGSVINYNYDTNAICWQWITDNKAYCAARYNDSIITAVTPPSGLNKYTIVGRSDSINFYLNDNLVYSKTSNIPNKLLYFSMAHLYNKDTTCYLSNLSIRPYSGINPISTFGATQLNIDPTAGPTITVQPQNKTVNDFASCTLSVTATASSGTLHYQWRKAASNVGTDANQYIFTAAYADNGAKYCVLVTDDNGTTVSDTSVVTVNKVTPVITGQPGNKSIADFSPCTLTVTATSGLSPINYQWQNDSSGSYVNVSGATSNPFIFTTKYSQTGLHYKVKVGNLSDTVLSTAATLTVTAIAPVISSHPGSVRQAVARTASFGVGAYGTGSLSFQWSDSTAAHTWTNIGGATSSGYTTGTLDTTYNGNKYRCVVTNATGSTTSNAALLTVVLKLATNNQRGPLDSYRGARLAYRGGSRSAWR